MADQPKAAEDFLSGLKLAQAEYERWQDKLRNPTLRRAFDLREQAWQIALSRAGHRETALALIEEAAGLDPEYLPQVTGIRNLFARRDRSGKVFVPRAVNRAVSPLLLSRGFGIHSPFAMERKWKQGCEFVRVHAGREQRISIGTGKFGKRLGLLVSRERTPGQYDYRDHRDFGCSHDALAYLNQDELDKVASRLAHLLDSEVLPWLDRP